jgi:flagellar basal body P-ring formation protein FlgA
MKSRTSMKNLMILVLIVMSHQTWSKGQYQSLSVLKETIERYAYDQLLPLNYKKVKVTIGSIDARLKLKHCPKDRLKVFNPYNSQITQTSTLGIKCADTKRKWTLYVPIDIDILTLVVICKHHLPKGTTISSNDIRLSERDIKQLKRGYFQNKEEVIGLITKHNLQPGRTISPYNLSLPALVNRGEEIIITAINKSIQVSMKGIAINSGTLGEIIRVKILSSNRIIEAKIVKRRKVEVNI